MIRTMTRSYPRGRVNALSPVLVTLAVLLSSGTATSAQTGRLNRLIEQVSADRAAVSGVDWQFIDMEHGPYLIDQLATRIGALVEAGADRPRLAPLVRIPMEGDEQVRFAVKQVLDAGAFGVVFPRIETADQAERAVQSMRFPPQRGAQHREPVGIRGWGPGRAARYWQLPLATYVERADVWPLNTAGELFAMIMIESARGVANIDDIVRVPGVGAIFIGPADLAMSLGVGPPLDGIAPETEAAIQTVLAACKTANVVCGIADSRDAVDRRVEEGFRVLLAF